MLYYLQKEKTPFDGQPAARRASKIKITLEVLTMSEKLFLIITVVFVSVAAIGPSFFNLHFIPAIICSLIPMACLPFMLADKKN